MSYTDTMEFKFEGEVANLTTVEKYKLTDGKPSTIAVRRGDPNNIFMRITASYSGMDDPDKLSILRVPQSTPAAT